MPGLVGMASMDMDHVRLLPKMVKELCHLRQYVCVSENCVHGSFANVHLNIFDHSVTAKTKDGTIGIILDGWIWNIRELSSEQEDAVQSCLTAYLSEGLSFVEKLNGEFNLIVWDKRRATIALVNDRFGLRPLQYAQVNDALFVAPEAKAILAAGAIPCKLDHQMVLNFLSVGRAYLGDRTFFEGVRLLPPASMLLWRAGRVTLSRYWDYCYRPRPVVTDEFIDELVTSFRQAVRRRLRSGLRYSITLSGGLDSRVVASAMARDGEHKPVAVSFGLADSEEINIAERVAQRLNMPWQFEELRPAQFIEHASEGTRITEGLDLFVQSYGMSVYPRLAEHADIAFTGLGLDVTLGGTCIESSLLDPDVSPEQARAIVARKFTYFSPDMVALLFGDPVYIDRVNDMLNEVWQQDDRQSLIDQADRFAFLYRCNRVLFQRQAWQRLFLEDATPTFDKDFVSLILQIPARERVEHRIYRRFMHRLCPELMDIPYQRTLIPPSSPIELWKEAEDLERRREILYEKIWQQTRGTVSIPYKRYATNYTQWLRTDRSWREWTNELLMSDHCLLLSIGLQGQFIRQLVEEHCSGVADHRPRLLQLLTLELFLRQYFDG